MSILIKSFHPNNVYYTRQDDIDVGLLLFLKSSHYDEVENIKDVEMLKLERLYSLYQRITNYLIVTGLIHDSDVNSGWRTDLINQLVGGQPTSQHPKKLAFDIKFLDKNGNTITGKKLAKIYDTIEEMFGIEILQMGLYETFIHIGLTTTKDKTKFARWNKQK